jgi:transcriptional regulator GlxA family with amidase domain
VLGTTPMAAKRLIVIVLFDGVTLMDVVSVAEAFEIAERFSRETTLGSYEVELVSRDGGAIRSWSGMAVETKPWSQLDGRPIDTIIVPGGGPPERPPVPGDAVAWLRANAERARRVCGVCTGTFLIAASGLADGRRVTTHWQAIGVLAEQFPLVMADADPIYVKDGRVWTSAGFAAGIDLALALIEEDEGHATAVAVAKLLVMFLKRPGLQPQLSALLRAQSADDPDFSRLHAWIAEHLLEDLRVERLATIAGMATRTFERQYTSRIGRTPGRTVAELRMDAAIRLMTSSGYSLKDVARRAGFQDEQNLRRAFLRLRGVTPEMFRKQVDELPASSRHSVSQTS